MIWWQRYPTGCGSMLSAIIATREFGTSARSHTGRAGPWCCCRPDRRGRHCGRRFAGRHGRGRRDRRVPLHQFKRSLGGPAECCRNKHPQPLADVSSRGCCAAARLDRRSRPLHAVNRRPRGRGSRRRVSPARGLSTICAQPSARSSLCSEAPWEVVPGPIRVF